MNLLISTTEFNTKKSRDNIPLQCKYCNSTFHKTKNIIQSAIKGNCRHSCEFCSSKCRGKYKTSQSYINIICSNCGTEIRKLKCDTKRNTNNFCSLSCAAIYNNTHKTKGTRRSKLESWLELELTKKYPNLEIHYNKTDAINAELDIYIPSLRVAFELNGIFHYEPIYGKDKLSVIQNNDKRKFQACLEHNIELCIIDTHNVKYLKLERDRKFLDIISNIIDRRVAFYH